MRASKSSGSSPTSDLFVLAAVVVLLAAISFSAATWVHGRGYTLYYGDAEAHLNIARRVVDSRTPGPEQLGTVWLPLPHIAMLQPTQPRKRHYDSFRSRPLFYRTSVRCVFLQ